MTIPELHFFTHNIFMHSPTYHKIFKGQYPTNKQDNPFVNMTADIRICQDDEETLTLSIHNKMWQDPIKADDGDSGFSVHLDLDITQLIYIRNYIDSFLKSEV